MHYLFQSPRWTEAWPGAVVGQVIIRNVTNPKSHPALDARKREVEAELRKKYGEMDRATLLRQQAFFNYSQYYGIYDKTYHVLGQFESVVHKGKPISSSSALVEAMFMAELEDQLLTAAHDLDKCQPPYSIDVGLGEETYVTASGAVKTIKKNDMYLVDKGGIVSSILHGPDQRTLITPETTNLMYFTYAPGGIGVDRVRRHLRRIMGYVQLFSPDCKLSAPVIQHAS